MTVLSEVSSVQYAGNGVTVTYAVPFPFQAATDLRAILIAANGLTGYPSFTASGVGNPSGGSITLQGAPPAGSRLLILRDPLLIQDASFVDHSRFPAKTVEDALDKARMVDQRTRQLALAAIRRPDTDATVDMELPAAAQRAGKILGFDGNGHPIVFSPSDLLPFVTPNQLTVSQFLRGLSSVVANGGARLNEAVPADPDAPDRVIYERSLTVAPGGAFETMAAFYLGLSPSVIAAIRAASVLQPN